MIERHIVGEEQPEQLPGPPEPAPAPEEYVSFEKLIAASPHSREHARQKAMAHVDWLLSVIRPLMIEQFIHGFKHGLEARCDVCPVPEAKDL